MLLVSGLMLFCTLQGSYDSGEDDNLEGPAAKALRSLEQQVGFFIAFISAACNLVLLFRCSHADVHVPMLTCDSSLLSRMVSNLLPIWAGHAGGCC